MSVYSIQDYPSINLNNFANTLPSKKNGEVVREQIIMSIEKTFSAKNKVLMIEGEANSGKSTLLAQFARKHNQNCISFFIGDDYWKSNVSFFLTELIEQMIHISSEGLKSKLVEYKVEELSEIKKHQLFSRLYTDLCKQAKNINKVFYFVIDGLEKVENSGEIENIIKYLPSGDAEGVYVLLSSIKGKDYTLDYNPIQIPYFSQFESENILKDFLLKEEIEYVHNACEGLPGYISEIHRQLILKDRAKEDIISSLPSSFMVLLEKNWQQYDHSDVNFIKFLSLMTYSPEPLHKEDVLKILGLSKYELETFIDQTSFIISKSEVLSLVNTYKTFFIEKLEEHRLDTSQLLIQFYENSDFVDSNAMIYLPEMYQEKNEYKSLVNLIDLKNIYKVIQDTQQMSIVRKNLRILSSMSYGQKDWNKLSWANLTEAIFTEIATTPPTVESEIKALLSLNLYQEALKLAFSCSLPEDRLILQSHICKYMKKNNIEISKDLTNSIDESIDLLDITVDLSEELIDKLIDICSNIFPVDVTLALKLLERISNKTGENVEREKLMDYLLIRLLFRVEKTGDDVDINQITEQIGSDDLQDFIKATTDSINEEDTEELFQRVSLINDTSAKLFYLANWCSKNSKSKNSYLVVEYALNIITESDEYSPTQRHLRQFAKPLEYSDANIDKIKQIVSKIETLQSTIIKNPIEEYSRLELSLAKIEKKWSEQLAVDRFLVTYIYLEEINDFDVKCLVLVYLMETHNEIIINEEDSLYTDFKDQLIMDFNRLLTSSADHFTISKKIIYHLTKIDKELALTFANKLNTEQRRFQGFAEIIKSHINNKDVDFTFLHVLSEKITDKPYKDYVLVQILKKLSKIQVEAPQNIKYKYFGLIKSISSFEGKCLAFAYYLNWIKGDPEKSNLAFIELKSNLIKLDDVNRLKLLGFNIVQILSEEYIEHAQSLYKFLTENYQGTNVFDSRLNELSSELIDLLIRMVPDILKAKDYQFKIRNMKNSILTLPSSYQKCVLLSNLALRAIGINKREMVREIIEEYIDILEECNEDCDTFNKIIVETSALLFEYDSSMFYEKLKEVNSREYRDIAIKNVIRFIISKRPLNDPIDLDSLQQKIEYSEAVDICDLIDMLEKDSNIYSAISIFIDALIEPKKNNKYSSRLREKQLLSIAEKLTRTIRDKLPDENNIKHGGYRIASFGCLTKLRDTAIRAYKRWDEMFPGRDDLKKEAFSLSNASDKIFVLASLCKNTYHSDNTLGTMLIKEADNSLMYTNNPLDRVDRYELVAESYQKISNPKAASYILEQAFTMARACSHEQGKDQMLGGLIDLAHNINPTLAQSYASNLDSNESFLNFNERLDTLNLHSDPKRIQNYNKEQTNKILNDFFSKVLRSLCSERGTIQHSEVIGKSLSNATGQSFETIILGVSWYIENTIGSHRNMNESELDSLFMSINELIQFLKNVEGAIYGITSDLETDNFYKVFTETSIHTFGLNEEEQANELILNWINQNAHEYIRICDPYFTEENLELIKNIHTNARMFIYSSCKTSEREMLPDRYISYWKRICDNVPPEINFQFFITNSGNTPLHDRFIISEKGGLDLGTSLNGYGSKYSKIKFLDIDEKNQLEQEMIFGLINMPPTQYKDEKLSLKMFTLN